MGEQFYCGLKPMLRADLSRSCVMQLYQGQTDPTWCQSRLRHGLVQPFVRLYNGSWIFSALTEQVRLCFSSLFDKRFRFSSIDIVSLW